MYNLKQVILTSLILSFFFLFIGYNLAPVKEPDVRNWEKLKAVDDRALMIASDMMGFCSESLTAASTYNFDELVEIKSKISGKTSELESLAVERQELLDKLDY